jgi:hypothetical protein
MRFLSRVWWDRGLQILADGLAVYTTFCNDDENRRRNLDLSPAFLGFEREVFFATVTGM